MMKNRNSLIRIKETPLSQLLFTLFPIVMLSWILVDSFVERGFEGLTSMLSMMSFGVIVVGTMGFVVYAGAKKEKHKLEKNGE